MRLRPSVLAVVVLAVVVLDCAGTGPDEGGYPVREGATCVNEGEYAVAHGISYECQRTDSRLRWHEALPPETPRR